MNYSEILDFGAADFLRSVPNLTRHFHHQPDFPHWLSQLAGKRPIWEYGAGMLNFSSALSKIHAPGVVAVEPRVPDDCKERAREKFALFPMFAHETFRVLHKDLLVVVCRPDHSGWVEEVMEKCGQLGIEFIYVGLPKNVDVDIDSEKFAITALESNCGEDGELAYRVRCR